MLKLESKKVETMKFRVVAKATVGLSWYPPQLAGKADNVSVIWQVRLQVSSRLENHTKKDVMLAFVPSDFMELFDEKKKDFHAYSI